MVYDSKTFKLLHDIPESAIDLYYDCLEMEANEFLRKNAWKLPFIKFWNKVKKTLHLSKAI